jgi:hypothetical protein
MWLVACSRSNSEHVTGDGGGGRTFDPCVADPKPGFDPSSKGYKTCCDVGPAHCVPSDDVLPRLASQLDACPDGNSVCMPDEIIRGGGQFMPATCTSSVGSAPGVCLSQCIPLVSTNPETAVLGQDGCADGELCIPCKNPLDGTSTGACDLVSLLCTSDDGGTSDGGGDGGGQTCPYTGPPLIDPNMLADCSPACGGAHCIPASLVPAAQQSLLAACSASSGGPGYCAPDELISTGGNFLPKSCTSVAGAEGRCLSTCLPSVAAEASVLPVDVCDANEKCVPCFNPTASDPTLPTGACTLSCDKPSQPPVVLTCPYSGPKVVDATQFPACDPTCYGSHCVPASLVPASTQSLLAACDGGKGFCTPDSLVEGGGESVPKSCRSIGGAEGRCLSTCLPPIAAEASLLPVDVCAQGEVCAPCFDPTAPSPQPATGACTLACDKPAEGPLQIACPYTGANLLDPAQFPSCSSATCANAHCLPAQYVPATQQALLSACPGGGFCAPDAIIGSINHFVPKSCNSVAGVEGRCISTCLPSVEAQAGLLPTAGCEDQPGTVCAPCYDPTNTQFMLPTGACSLACDAPKTSPAPLACPYPSSAPDVINPAKFPSCASSSCQTAHCLPATLVPAAEQALLAPCGGGGGFCTPDEIIRTDNNFVPKSCNSLAGVEGRCVSTCLPSVEAEAFLLPTAGCESDPGTVCAPCFDPTGANVTAPTGACSIGCDMPAHAPSPTPIACPYTGANIIDPTKFPSCATNSCSNAHCLPASLVPAAEQALLSACAGGGFCTPDTIIGSVNHFVPPTCTSIAGAEGRCISTCLPSVSALASILPTAGCAAGTVCAPCFNPTATDPRAATGACSLACDKPTQPAVILTCPWPVAPAPNPKPPVINPATLPTCGCTGAHCLPSAAVPAADQTQLNTCTGGFCTPDTIIATGGNFKPAGCIPFAGVTNNTQGRCLSDCLKAVQSNGSLEQATCAANLEKCAPCADPFTGADSGACHLSSCDAAPTTVFKFPNCCVQNGGRVDARCVPTSQVPAGTDTSKLLENTCNNANYLCIPNELLPAPYGKGGQACSATTLLHLGGYNGTCLSECLDFPALIGLEYGEGNCPSNHRCIGCADAPAGLPGCP